MKALKRFIDLIRLYYFEKNAEKNVTEPEVFLNNIFKYKKNFYKSTKGSMRRNLIASTIKKIRTISPYKPIDYSKAKKMYEDYFNMTNHIPSYEQLIEDVKSGKEIYVVNFRSEAPVKGKRSQEYHINKNSSKNSTYKVNKLKELKNCSYIKLSSVSGNSNVVSITKDFFTCYRYATEEEVSEFKTINSKIKDLKDKVKEKQKEISAIVVEINQYEKNLK